MVTLRIDYARIEAVRVALEVHDADLETGREPQRREPVGRSRDRISPPVIHRVPSKRESA